MNGVIFHAHPKSSPSRDQINVPACPNTSEGASVQTVQARRRQRPTSDLVKVLAATGYATRRALMTTKFFRRPIASVYFPAPIGERRLLSAASLAAAVLPSINARQPANTRHTVLILSKLTLTEDPCR